MENHDKEFDGSECPRDAANKEHKPNWIPHGTYAKSKTYVAEALIAGVTTCQPMLKAVVGVLVASSIVVTINLFILAIDGRLTFHPYDPVGNILVAQSTLLNAKASHSDLLSALFALTFTIDSGLYISLIALSFEIFGFGMWQPCLVLFWQ